MKTLELMVSKIRAVQVFKRHQGTGSPLEPQWWWEHCKRALLGTTMENKWLSVAKYQWITEFRPMSMKSFSCGMPFLWMLHPSGWINCRFKKKLILDTRAGIPGFHITNIPW